MLIAGLLLLPTPARSTVIVKANNADGMANGTSWVGGVAPTASDTALFDATFNNTDGFGTGAPLSWLGMEVTGGTSTIDIRNGAVENWVGIGAGGLIISPASARTIYINSLQQQADHTWSVATGNNLFVGYSPISAAQGQSGRFEQANSSVLSLAGGGTISITDAIAPIRLRDTSAFTGSLNTNGTDLALVADTAESIVFGGTLSGTTTISKSGAGTYELPGASFGSSVDVSAGTLVLSGNNTFSGDALTKSGAGTLLLSGSNSYTGTTTISAGTLQVGDGSTTGSLGSGNIALSLGATLAFDRSDDISLSNQWDALTSGGTRTLRNDGTGLVTLAGNSNNIGAGGASGEVLVLDGSGSGLIEQSFASGGADLGIRKEGAGTWTFTNDSNGYSGATTISEGTLQIGNGGATGTIGTGDLELSAGATLAFNRTAPLTVANDWISFTDGGIRTLRNDGTGKITLDGGNIGLSEGTTTLALVGSGDGEIAQSIAAGGAEISIAKEGAGTWTLSNAATNYSGSTTISAGTLEVSGLLGAGNYGEAIANDGELHLNSASAQTLSGDLSGSGLLRKSAAGTLTLSGTNTYTGGTTLAGGTLALGSADALGSTGTITLSGGTLQFSASNTADYSARFATVDNQAFNFDTNGQDVTLATGLTSSSGGSLAKSGTGTLTLSSASSYDGSTTISAGTLEVTSPLGTGTYAGAIANDGELHINTASAQTLSGDLSGSGLLRKSAAGTLTLSGTNSYTGGTTLAGGTLALGSADALGSAGTITLSGGTLQFSAGNTADYSARFATVDNQAFNFDTNGQDVAFASGLASSGGTLAKTGTGTLTLAGSNTYTGGTTITAGTLEVSGLLGAGTYGEAIANDGELHLNSASAQTLSGDLSGSGLLRKSAAGTLTLSGTNTYTGGTTLAGGTLALGSADALGSTGTITLAGGTLQFSASNTTDYSARFATVDNQAFNFDTNGQDVTLATGLTSSSGGSLAKSGTGTLTLSSASSYDGTTTVAAGTLRIADGGSLGTGNIDIPDGTLEFTRPTATSLPNQLFVKGTGSSPALLNNGAGLLTIQPGTSTNIQVDHGETFTVGGSGDIVIEKSIAAGAGASLLTKTGTGTVTLTSPDNNWSGGTTIAEGVLQVGDGTSDGTIGTGTITITNGRLAFNRPNPYTVAETIATFQDGTTPGIENNGAGLLTVDASNLGFSVGATGITLDLGGTGDGLMDGPIANGGAAANILKDGTGTWTFDDANTNYSGTTTISAGTLEITGRLGQGSYAPTISNDATLHFNSTSAQTLSGVISGAGTLEKSNSGTLTLSGTNTYSGATTINAGTLLISGSGSLGSGSYAGAITNDGTLEFATTANQTLSGGLSGSGDLVKGGGNQLTIAGAFSMTGDISLPDGTLEFTRPTATSLPNQLFVKGTGSSPALLNNGAGLLTIQPGTSTNIQVDHGETFTVGGSGDLLIEKSIASGAGASLLTKTGTGTVTLTSPANNWSGGTTISAGVLQVGDGTSDGAIGSGTITITNGRLAFNRASPYTVAETIATFQDGTTPGIENNGAGLLTVDAANLGFNVGGTGIPLTFGGTGDGLVDGPIASGGAAADIVKDGTGTWTFDDADTNYSGTTTVSAGTLEITGRLGQGSYAEPISNDATLRFNSASAQTLSGVISGAGTLHKSNTGTVSLEAANTFSGLLLIDGGSLALAAGGSLAAAVAAEINGGSLDIAGKTQTIAALNGTGGTVDLGAGSLTIANTSANTYAGAITGTGSLAKSGAGDLVLSGANTYSGGTTVAAGRLVGDSSSLQGDIANEATVEFNQAADGTYAGVLSGSGAVELAGGGTLTLTGTNTYTGATTISDGTLQVGDGGTDGTLGGTGAIANDGMLAFNRSDAVTLDRAVTGTGALSHAGSGSLTLTGTNTYSGGTTVAAGALRVDGSIASSAVSLASGAALSGSGLVGAISGAGSLNPGQSPGILTATSVDLSSGLDFNFEFTQFAPDYGAPTASGNDVLHLTDSTPFLGNFSGSNTINVYLNVAEAPAPDDTYVGGFFIEDDPADLSIVFSETVFNYYLADANGAVAYDGSNYRAYDGEYAFHPGWAAQSAQFAGSAQAIDGFSLELTTVPEPRSSAFLLGLAAGLLVLMRRRRARFSQPAQSANTTPDSSTRNSPCPPESIIR